MERDKIVNIIMVIIFGIFLQVIFVVGDLKETPNKVAAEFAEAYYKLDKSMAGYLCKTLISSEDTDIVDKYLQTAQNEAAERGLSPDFLKSKLFNIETSTISKTDKEVTMRLTADRIVSVNPVYAVVAKLFQIGKVHKVDDTITVIKEDRKWKVCGKPFSLL